jgi:hypothetical protein
MYAITSATLPGVVRDAAYLARRMPLRRRAAGAKPRSIAIAHP